MRVRIVLTKQQALATFEAIATHHEIALPAEWMSQGYAAPYPFVTIDLVGVPAARAVPESWRERLSIFVDWVRGRRNLAT